MSFLSAAPEGTQIKLGIYTNSVFGEINVISRALSCLRRVLTAVKPAKPAPIIVIFFIFQKPLSFEDDENFGLAQGEILSIAGVTKVDVLDFLQVLYDKLQDEEQQL
jgi:hypothetical protein